MCICCVTLGSLLLILDVQSVYVTDWLKPETEAQAYVPEGLLPDP